MLLGYPDLGVRVSTLTRQDQQGPCYGTARPTSGQNPAPPPCPPPNTTSSLHGHVQDLKPCLNPTVQGPSSVVVVAGVVHADLQPAGAPWRPAVALLAGQEERQT